MASCDIGKICPDRNPWEDWAGLPAYTAWLEADIAGEEASNPHLWADEDQSGDLCYFMGGDTGPIKIGFARDPWSRLGRIQSGCAFPITVLAVEHGGRRRESAYHQEFSRFRVHGEWFERSPEMMQAIRELQESMRETPLSPRASPPRSADHERVGSSRAGGPGSGCVLGRVAHQRGKAVGERERRNHAVVCR